MLSHTASNKYLAEGLQQAGPGVYELPRSLEHSPTSKSGIKAHALESLGSPCDP